MRIQPDMTSTSELDETQQHWLQVYRDAKQKAKQYEERAAAAREMLMDGFSEATAVVGGRPVFAIKTSTPRRFDKKSFEEDHPGLTDAYYRDGKESQALFLIGDE